MLYEQLLISENRIYKFIFINTVFVKLVKRYVYKYKYCVENVQKQIVKIDFNNQIP